MTYHVKFDFFYRFYYKFGVFWLNGDNGFVAVVVIANQNAGLERCNDQCHEREIFFFSEDDNAEPRAAGFVILFPRHKPKPILVLRRQW